MYQQTLIPILTMTGIKTTQVVVLSRFLLAHYEKISVLGYKKSEHKNLCDTITSNIHCHLKLSGKIMVKL